MKKTLISILLVTALLILFAGCAATQTSAPSTQTPTAAIDNNTPTPEATPEVTPEATPTPTPTQKPKGTPMPEVEVPHKELEAMAQPEAEGNGLVNLRTFIQSVRSVEKWADNDKALRLFDGSTGSKMIIEDCNPTTVIMSSPVQIKIASYTFVTDTTNDSAANNTPVTWKFYGANLSNYEDAVLLDEQTNAAMSKEHLGETTFSIANPGYYVFYKFVFTDTAGHTNTFQLNQIKYWGADGDCVGGYLTYNSDISDYYVLNLQLKTKLLLMTPHPQMNYKVADYFDNDIETFSICSTQYAQDNVYVSYMIVFQSAIEIDAYRFTMRDAHSVPVTWELYGASKSNLEDAVLIDSETNASMPSYDYAESDVFTVDNPGEYKYYELRIYDDWAGNDENWKSPEWREMTLLQRK